jgi:hypothetical protein
VRCEEVARLLPEEVDGDGPASLPVQRHVESCLHCQAEVVRYRRMLRGLHLLRTQYLEPTPGGLSQTLAAISAAGGAVAAAGATTAAVLVARARRRATVAH